MAVLIVRSLVYSFNERNFNSVFLAQVNYELKRRQTLMALMLRATYVLQW